MNSRRSSTSIHDRPLAGPGLISYRYKGTMGWVMIGATGHADALKQAQLSVTERVDQTNLQVWAGDCYAAAA